MLGKLALRNAKRSVKDYLICLITITISFSLLLAFHLVANSDEVAALSWGMESFRTILRFANAAIVFVVCFLINYTTKFMFEKRSRELGMYMLLGIRKKAVAWLLVLENVLLGAAALLLAVPLGFVFSQFVSLMIVRLLGIPGVIFITLAPASVASLALYFLAIYFLVLLNLLRRIGKMTVQEFLYLDKRNEKKMFASGRKRNVVFVLSAELGIAALLLWNLNFQIERVNQQETLNYLIVSLILLIVSIYGISATCADMLLSVLLRSKKLKYRKDNLFVARTFASKARTMSAALGALSMLILLALLCLNISGICKGVYKMSIEQSAPFDVHAFGDRQSFDGYVRAIGEEYTIEQVLKYDVYKEPLHQIQNFYSPEFYDYDPLIKASDYNQLRKLKGLEETALGEDEYILVTSGQLLYKAENNDGIKTLCLSGGEELTLKEIETETYWFNMTNSGRFVAVVPDRCVQGLEIEDSHLVVDTREETTAKLEEKLKKEMRDYLVTTDEDGETADEFYRVSVRGTAVEEQNTMTAMIASLCLYFAFILISVVGTILAVQSLSDAAKYKYRYRTLRRLGVNDDSLSGTVRKQLLIFFCVPVALPTAAAFCMLTSINRIYRLLLKSGYIYLLYFAGSLAAFLLIYGIYWIAAYIGFKRNIKEGA